MIKVSACSLLSIDERGRNLEKIGLRQLFLVMLAFEVGSAIIFSLGAEAKQNAWFAVLVGMGFGLVLVSVFTKLSGYYPGHSFIEIIQNIFGRLIGFPLSITYILYFTSQAARISRDFTELIISTILVGTPALVIISSFVAVIIYTLRGGIEVFGRMAEMVFPVVMVVFLATWIIVCASGVVDPTQLSPVLGGELSSIWQDAFPILTSLPFGELIAFTMVWTGIKDNRKLKTVGRAVVLSGGILLSLNIAGMISVLGSPLYSRLNYPLLATVRMASVADFLERIDAVVILLMVAGGFFKVGVYLYAAAVGTAHLFQLQSYRSVLVPLGTIIVTLGLIMARNVVEHNVIGLEFLMTYGHLPLQFVIPALLLIIAYFHEKRRAS
ncbi:endospore germination permease [Ammoniphilus sp. 3BR4]|uniref:GerAB/ArcD/ProY family transporter n=1 Tax=Ammoniphilus sp. 3BR4 TaxID=3158265 RepID=UPI0034667093